ncbi:MAG TPA: DNA recombination protein RmuC [Bacteroidales bacterium]|nr:DNA recombination protein RmuC [Bacteroidales bacterium]HOK97999.1 DNA recombination protein RmuC [Bacteroidales bacterium]HPO65310.1 DNA recombination protein RmuC [Bacteroidales bacterium]
MLIVYILTAFLAGCLLTFVLLHSKYRTEIRVAEEKFLKIENDYGSLQKQLDDKQQQITDLIRQNSTLEAQHSFLKQKLDEQKAELENMQEKLTVTFRNLANDILEEKAKKFTEQNKVNLDEILKPLGEKIKEFEKKVEETYDKEAQQRFSLKEEVKRLAEMNQLLSEEARNLVRALKGDTKTQGNWGEMLLESILEKSGLIRDQQYFIQPSFTSAEGNRLRPDVVILYPGNRSIVVDSKVSLTAYDRYVSAETEEDRRAALREHIMSVRKHIDELSKKQYQNIPELRTLDFVMLFIPIEPAYLLLMQQEAGIWNEAYDKRILLISPTNLIAALKMVESIWRQEKQNRNAEEIARVGGELYDQLTRFVEELIELGKKIQMTQQHYQNAMQRLAQGRGNVIKRAEQLKLLGAKTSKSFPDNLLNRALDEE